MNGTIKAVSTAVLFALGSTSAFAASNAGLPGIGTQTDPGDLVFAYAAADGQSSIVWDLSNGSDDLTWGSVLTSAGFTISNAAVSDFVTANPGGRWAVFGLTNTSVGGTAANLQYDQAGFGLTIAGGAPNVDAPNGNKGGPHRAELRNSAAWIAAANEGGLPNNGTLRAGAADPWIFLSENPIADQAASGLVGETLAYWTILIDNTVTRGFNDTQPNRALGNAPFFTQVTNAQGEAMGFTFAADGSLSYGAIQPIPVPAAVWLMGSALAGLGALRRRQA